MTQVRSDNGVVAVYNTLPEAGVKQQINREINLASSDPGIATDLLDELFLPDFAHSAEMHQPFPQQWADCLIELMGDYMF